MLLRRFYLFLLLATFLITTGKTAAADQASVAGEPDLRGERIYHGKENIKAKIAGHGEWLTPSASRCVNCHSGQRPNAIAPPLTRAWLTTSHPRRGGPVFAYDLPSFCKTLRVGIDPEYVMLNRTMPRFDINDRQCAALWAYLMKESENGKK